MVKFLNTLLLCFVSGSIFAQLNTENKKVIQFSGIVVYGDSLYGIPGAAVISLNSNTGTNTNMMGFFSMPVYQGDSIVVACINYKRRYLSIPKDSPESYSIVIHMQRDTIQLPMIDLTAFPSEEVFKEIILSMETPGNGSAYSNMKNNLDEQILNRLAARSDIPGAVGFRNTLDKQAMNVNLMRIYQTNNFLDPFAWGRFIRNVKEEKKKKEEEKKKQINKSNY